MKYNLFLIFLIFLLEGCGWKQAFLREKTESKIEISSYENPRIDSLKIKSVALLVSKEKLAADYLLRKDIKRILEKEFLNKGYIWLDNPNYADGIIKTDIIEKLGKSNSMIYIKVSIYNQNNILIWEGIGCKKRWDRFSITKFGG